MEGGDLYVADGRNHGEALVRLDKVCGEWGRTLELVLLLECVGSVCHTNNVVAYFTESMGKKVQIILYDTSHNTCKRTTTMDTLTQTRIRLRYK